MHCWGFSDDPPLSSLLLPLPGGSAPVRASENLVRWIISSSSCADWGSWYSTVVGALVGEYLPAAVRRRTPVRRQVAAGWGRARAAPAGAITRAAMVDRKKLDGNGGNVRASRRRQGPSGTGWSGPTPVGMVRVETTAHRRR